VCVCVFMRTCTSFIASDQCGFASLKMFICSFSQNRVNHCTMQLVVEEEEEVEKEV